MLTTDTLIRLLRLHDHIPFTLQELKRLFARPGIDERVAEELGRNHMRHDEMLQLAARVLRLFEDMQRQKETSSPIATQSMVLLLQFQAHQHDSKGFTSQEVEAVLALLSNRVTPV